MKNIFTERDVQYNLRSKYHLQLPPNVKTRKYRIENIQYIDNHLWASAHEEIKDFDTLTNFRQKIISMEWNYLHPQMVQSFY